MKDALIRLLKKVGTIFFVVLVSSYVLVLWYALPRTVVVNITGTEVKRNIDNMSTDVRYILAENIDGDPMIFKNADTGWGFPPYFKFDSGTVAARAHNLATKDAGSFVLIRFYGFRIPMISAFPNAVSLKVVDENYDHFPLFNIVFLALNVVIFAFLGIKYTLWKRRRKKRTSAEEAPAATPASA